MEINKSIEEAIEETKQGFENSFKEASYYNKQTADSKHIKLLLELVNPIENDTILDLGTGSGYIAFSLAKQNPDNIIIGLDIVVDTLERNKMEAIAQGYRNLEFVSYDGRAYPFKDGSINTIITRYALHHFPNIEDSFREMFRVLTPGGKLVISDPTPNVNDTVGFADKFMQMKPDGHVRFYFFSEFKNMLERNGFKYITQENTVIRFPRKNPMEYKELLESYDKDIVSGYEIKISEEEIWIKENVLNMVFQKNV